MEKRGPGSAHALKDGSSLKGKAVFGLWVGPERISVLRRILFWWQ
jgi:hypothetical protein